MEQYSSTIHKRPSWDEFWLMQALYYSTRGTCDRLRTACVIVDKNNRLLSAGYNGSTPGAAHCDDAGHLLIDGHCLRTLHAEENALLHAVEHMRGATAYLLFSPCLHCAKRFITAGIKRIVYAKEFSNMHGQDEGWQFVRELFTQRDISFEKKDIDFYSALNNTKTILEGPGGVLRGEA